MAKKPKKELNSEVIDISEVKKVDLKFSKKFITRSLRGQNYDLETALSELIDNSIDADSKNVTIEFPKKSDFDQEKSTVIIEDDGDGMTEEMLISSMTLGSERDYDNSEIGYFGIGMKASLAYLSESVVIKTKRQGDDFYSKISWNVDEDTSFSVEKEFTSDISKKGTKIIIHPGWRYDHYSHTQDSNIKKKFGARYYHLLYVDDNAVDNYLKQIRIFVNSEIVTPNDPMYRNCKSVEYWERTIPYEDDVIKITGYNLLNIENSDEINKYDISQGGKKGYLSTDKSGVYVLYNRKYINLGGTFLGKIKIHPEYNSLRIELSIPKGTTEYFGISMNKNSITEFLGDDKHTDSIKEKIKKYISEITSLFNSQKDSLRKGQNLKDPDKLKDIESLTNKLNNELKSKGLTKTPMSNPEIAKKVTEHKKQSKKDTPKSTKNRPEDLKYEKNLFDIVPFSGGPTNQFWELNRSGTKIVMRINVDHSFYEEFISNSSEETQKKMYKLLYSLAYAQLETLGIWDFDGKIHELWAEFWNDTGKILKRTLDK